MKKTFKKKPKTTFSNVLILRPQGFSSVAKIKLTAKQRIALRKGFGKKYPVTDNIGVVGFIALLLHTAEFEHTDTIEKVIPALAVDFVAVAGSGCWVFNIDGTKALPYRIHDDLFNGLVKALPCGPETFLKLQDLQAHETHHVIHVAPANSIAVSSNTAAANESNFEQGEVA